MSELEVSHEQIKQLAMDWYDIIMAEIKAEKEGPGEEVITKHSGGTQKNINTNAA